MTDLQRKAREAAKAHRADTERHYYTDNERCTKQVSFELGYLAAAAPREQEIERLRARVVEVTAQRDAFMDSREEVVALRASLVQQAHDYRAQVVFWGENADQRTAEVASLRARVAELEGYLSKAQVALVYFTRVRGDRILDKDCNWLILDSDMKEAIINAHNKEHND